MPDLDLTPIGHDPDLDDQETAAEPAQTILDELRADLSADVTDVPTAVYPVPLRPGYAIRCRTNLSQAELTAADTAGRGGRKRRLAATTDAPLDAAVMSAAVILITCTELIRHGDVVRTGGGEPLALRSRGFVDMLGVPTARDAVRRLFGGPGGEASLVAVGNAIVMASGWGDDADAEDPTQR